MDPQRPILSNEARNQVYGLALFRDCYFGDIEADIVPQFSPSPHLLFFKIVFPGASAGRILGQLSEISKWPLQTLAARCGLASPAPRSEPKKVAAIVSLSQ
jgi:hypothetical protein